MKFLILFAVFVASVFEANCSDNTIGPDGAVNLDFTDEQPQYTPDESSLFGVDFQQNADVNERNQIELRGNAEKKVLKKILKIVEDLNGKVDSLEDVNSKQNTKLDSLEDVNSNQNTKLDLIIKDIKELSKNEECPENMFTIGFGKDKQCFKFFNDTQLQWSAAKSKCQQESLVLAEPKNPIPLRAYLVKTYNPPDYTWLGAQGDGTSMRWLRRGTVVDNGLIWGGSKTTSDYLFLLTSQSYLKNQPTKPYYGNKGTYTMYALCELILN